MSYDDRMVLMGRYVQREVLARLGGELTACETCRGRGVVANPYGSPPLYDNRVVCSECGGGGGVRIVWPEVQG